MADIFLSYSEQDRDAARRVVALLESGGCSVWWDRRIPAGENWRLVLDRAMAEMKCMVVLWSRRSVKSEWVCEEASEGRRLGMLVPVMIEPVRPPAGFREIQAADLTAWDGALTHAPAQALVIDIQSRLARQAGDGRDTDIHPSASTPKPAVAVGDDHDVRVRGQFPVPTRTWIWRGAAVALATAAAAVVWWMAPQHVRPTIETDVARSTPAPPRSEEPTTMQSPPPTPKPAEVATPANLGSAMPQQVNPTPAASTASNKARAVASSARCNAVLERLQLGETLSAADRAVLKTKECSP